jgi:hypothetical protein
VEAEAEGNNFIRDTFQDMLTHVPFFITFDNSGKPDKYYLKQLLLI